MNLVFHTRRRLLEGSFVALASAALATSAFAFASGSGTCEVDDDFSSITGMGDRTRVESPGDYVVTTSAAGYSPGETITVNLSGAPFNGFLLVAVDESGTQVGEFAEPAGTRLCGGGEPAASTHSSSAVKADLDIDWTAPNSDVGPIYFEAYVYDSPTRTFYRLVRDDGAPVVTSPSSSVELLADRNPLQLRNIPNPFAGSTAIHFRLAEEMTANLDVIDANGKRISTLVSRAPLPAGHYVVNWDGKDERGRDVSSGVYFYHLVADGISDTRRMLLIR